MFNHSSLVLNRTIRVNKNNLIAQQLLHCDAGLSTATAWVLCPVSALLPTYLILVLCGWNGLKGVLPAVIVSGGVFGGTEFVILNYAGVQLTNILSALISLVALLVLFRFWKPKDEFTLSSHHVMEMQ